MRYHVEIGGRSFEVDVGDDGVRIDGRAVEVALERAEATPVRALALGGSVRRLLARRVGSGRWRVQLGGAPVVAEVVDERTRAIRERAGAAAAPSRPAPVLAPMPGLVVHVAVAEGDVVAAGQGVAIVEAMKMENELRASAAGVVTRVLVRRGQTVEKDQLLVELAALEGSR
ncbi:MAG TPA: acetyl-CoA carboxylase biotin carboxyl carrier protein subunit [Longimicrobiales bacterium]|nr:acetyl-CoA carboxylase biotin carboxyl carrier protein subunit [Longimicrobiales bacterium]